MSDTVESFSALLRNALGDRLTPDASSFAEMFHPDGVMEFPFAFGDMPKQVVGRDALIRHLSSLADRITFERMGEARVLETATPETVILEFEGFGRGVETGEPYEQSYVSIIRTEGGHIVHYKDYWNPLAVLRTLNGSKALTLFVAGEVQP